MCEFGLGVQASCLLIPSRNQDTCASSQEHVSRIRYNSDFSTRDENYSVKGKPMNAPESTSLNAPECTSLNAPESTSLNAPESTSLSTFWLGVVVGIAFRTFAYGILYAGFLLPSIRGFPPVDNNILAALYWMVAIATLGAPFWIPFAAGFLSACFWGHLEAGDYVRAIWLSAIGFLVVAVALSLILGLGPVIILLFLCIFLDVGLCGQGADKGNLFWQGQLGRQFLGDFSTRDEDEAVWKS